MEISELRIGNYVLDNGLIHKIVSIRQKDYGKWVEDGQSNIIAMWDGAFYDCTEKEISPIILTEELLLKLGAKRDIDFNNQIYYQFEGKEEAIYILYKDSIYFHAYEYDGMMYETYRCTGLHSLQNKYYALNGVELEVNL